MKQNDIRKLCYALSFLLIACGLGGMVLSFLFLASASMADIHAGNSGFLAGSFMIGSGVISLSILAGRDNQNSSD